MKPGLLMPVMFAGEKKEKAIQVQGFLHQLTACWLQYLSDTAAHGEEE